MSCRLTIPARINILGNPSDANEGDFATISAAINVFANAAAQTDSIVHLELRDQEAKHIENNRQYIQYNLQEEHQRGEYPLPYNGVLDLIKGAFNRLYLFSPEFRLKYPQQGIHLTLWSEVPRQSGLGGSTLLVLLTLAALREVYDLDRREHNDYFLAELAQRVEAKELGIACGFADRYVPLFGGLAYLDYRGKLHQAEMFEEPFVTYEKLDRWVKDLPLVVATTGVQHQSGDVHGRMRPRYIQEWDEWQMRGGNPPRMVEMMQGAWETAWRGKIAMLHGDLATFGELMNTNHRIVNEMMCLCGFQDGAGWANNLFIQTALENGALGAKLTGAGGGGSVFALTPPGEEGQLIEAWEATAQKTGLKNAKVFRPKISQGLVIET